ncbi:MAG TPA: diguanylate cyclase [Abditibacteriaceae bacterium]|jgi:two-component system cell cycle response regulator
MSVEILVVDDSRTQAMKLQFILEEQGFAVQVAHDAREAIEMAQARPPALIVSDIVMPGMDGYVMCQHLKADETLRRVPVILLTTLADPRDILRGLQAQADAYLTKPYDEKVLVTRINTLLQQPTDNFDRDGRLTAEFLARDTPGLEVYLEGEHHVVTAGRRQMLNLLLSTYENAVRQNRALSETQRELTSLNSQLQDLNTQLQTQNQRIERSETNYRALLNDKTDAVFVVDGQGMVRFVNPAGEELLGKSEMEIWGLPFPYGFTLGGVREVEISPPVPGKDEDGLIAEMHAVPSEWEGEKVALVTLRDITARKGYERRIQEQQDALQQANQQLHEANRRLQELATLDGLTGIFNHRAAKERLATEWTRARRYDAPLSVLMLDVDKFKQYNDSFGHPAGDEILKGVAALLRDKARETDIVARYGGEEFIVILPNTGEEASTTFAERLRVAIEETPWPLRVVTASFGAATMSESVETSDDLVSIADQALYYSKEHGRNRVTHYSEVAGR